MNRLFTTIISFVAIVIILSPTTFAQTPDGVTPANEGVCDVLTNATPGLYGLCVAFCEAQDIADELTAITEDDLEALEAAMPSGAILNAYNSRKAPEDPDMPCILVEEPCPCWTEEELWAIDNLFQPMTGGPVSGPGVQCDVRGQFGVEVFEKSDQLVIGIRSAFMQAIANQSACLFQRQAQFPEPFFFFRFLRVDPNQSLACRTAIVNHARLYGCWLPLPTN